MVLPATLVAQLKHPKSIQLPDCLPRPYLHVPAGGSGSHLPLTRNSASFSRGAVISKGTSMRARYRQ